MRDLHNNPNITIKPTDKGESMVIMNTVDYVKEAQINDTTKFWIKTPQSHTTDAYIIS